MSLDKAYLKFTKEEFIRIVQALSKETNISTLIEFKEKQNIEDKNKIQNWGHFK